MKSEARLGWLLVAPALGVIALIAIFPLGWTVWESLHMHELRMPWLGKPFIGLANYVELAGDPRFWAALGHTVFFTVVSISLELVIGLFLALAMNRVFRGRGFVRAAVLVPWAIPTVVAALLWRFIFESQGGIANAILVDVGILQKPMVWFIQTATAWVPVILADVWKTTPFVALLLAGLQNIDLTLYEAAAVDGANAWWQLRHITLPLLKPAILVTLIFRTLDGFRVFDLIYVLTGGGPGTSTEPVALYTFNALLQNLRFGYGSALSVVIFAITFALALLYVKGLGVRLGGRRAMTFRWGRWLLGALLVALMIFTLFPFYWAMVASLTSDAALFRDPSLLPRAVILDHYRALFDDRDFLTPIRNSLIVAGTTTAFCLAVGTLAAYALARLDFKGKAAIMAFILAVTMFPQISIVSPLYLLLRWLRLIDTYPGLIMPYMTFAMPLTVWILTGSIRQIPRDLEEAAHVDGASRRQSFTKILLPLAVPSLATTAILTFIYCWNEFLFALSFTLGPERQTVPVAIALFRGQYQVPWGEILAAAVVATAPVAAMVLVFQRRIVQGLTAGAVKG